MPATNRLPSARSPAGSRLAIVGDPENSAVLYVGYVHIALDVNAEAVAERLVRITLDTRGQLRIRCARVRQIDELDAIQRRTIDGTKVQPLVVDRNAINAALEGHQSAAKGHLVAVIVNQVVFGRHGCMFLEDTAGGRRCDVVHDQRRALTPEARIRNDDRAPVAADLQVLQIRTCGRDGFGEKLVVNQFARRKIECEQTRGAHAMVAMVYGPEAVLPVNRDAQHRVEQSALRPNIRKRHRRAVSELHQLVASRP
jgi:hypothetical protein